MNKITEITLTVCLTWQHCLVLLYGLQWFYPPRRWMSYTVWANVSIDLFLIQYQKWKIFLFSSKHLFFFLIVVWQTSVSVTEKRQKVQVFPYTRGESWAPSCWFFISYHFSLLHFWLHDWKKSEKILKKLSIWAFTWKRGLRVWKRIVPHPAVLCWPLCYIL